MRQLGILQVLLSGFCFGFLGLFGKKAYELGLNPGEFLALRFLVAATLLGLFLLMRAPTSLRLPLTALVRCVLLGVLGYAVFSSCYFEALGGLSVSLTVLLLYTYPVIVCLGAWAFFGERLGRYELGALPPVCLGLALLVWGEMEVRSGIALVFGFLSSLFYSAYILASSRWLKGHPPFVTAFYIMASAGVVLGLVHFRAGLLPLAPGVIPVVLGTAFVSTLLAMSLFLAGLQKLSNSEVSLLSTAEPVTGVALATLFWGESLTQAQWSGGALVIFGMLLVARANRGKLEKGAEEADA
jgi:drug/metabolite transporter (DMT)-like permease